jgi:Outer membrane protein and related peptidoglycan-associated (lipo)proteins
MQSKESNQGLSNSFTDLMTSIAIVFILLLCASLNNAQQEGENTRNNILADLQKELKEFVVKGMEVKPDPKDPLGLLILVPEGLLEFALDKTEIPNNGVLFLRSFIPKLAYTVCLEKYKNEINSIVVEGHTDSSGTDKHNWELSQQRSMSVVRECLFVLREGQGQAVFQDDANARNYFLKFLSASGRGSAELIIDPSGKENCSLSRRVIFKIRVRSFEQKPLVELLGISHGK